jgi:hypothetical protein
MSDPNWAEVVTAIATAVGSVGLVSTLGLVLVSGRQLREAQHARHAQLAADFIRRWDEDSLVETRRLVAQFSDRDALAAAFRGYVETNSVSAYVLYRELDFFEQLGALESIGAFDFDLIKVLAGPLIVDRHELWLPSIAAMGENVYPMFGALAGKLRRALAP